MCFRHTHAHTQAQASLPRCPRPLKTVAESYPRDSSGAPRKPCHTTHPPPPPFLCVYCRVVYLSVDNWLQLSNTGRLNPQATRLQVCQTGLQLRAHQHSSHSVLFLIRPFALFEQPRLAIVGSYHRLSCDDHPRLEVLLHKQGDIPLIEYFDCLSESD